MYYVSNIKVELPARAPKTFTKIKKTTFENLHCLFFETITKHLDIFHACLYEGLKSNLI